jgi:hypothetical protein
MRATLKNCGVAVLAAALVAAAAPAVAQDNDRHGEDRGVHGGGQPHGNPGGGGHPAPQQGQAPAARPAPPPAAQGQSYHGNAWQGARPQAAQPQGQRPGNPSAWQGGRPPAAQPQGQHPGNPSAWEGHRPPAAPGRPPQPQPAPHEAWQQGGGRPPAPQAHGNDWQENRNNWQENHGRPPSWEQGRPPQGYYPGSGQRWSRDWHNDRHYDWHGYRYANRGVYRLSPYYAPYHGWGYRQLSVGFILQPLFYGSAYWIGDPYTYRLPPVYGPYRWVRYYNDALLVNIYTGEVVDVAYGIFW